MWSLISFSRHTENIVYPGDGGKGKFLLGGETGLNANFLFSAAQIVHCLKWVNDVLNCPKHTMHEMGNDKDKFKAQNNPSF